MGLVTLLAVSRSGPPGLRPGEGDGLAGGEGQQSVLQGPGGGHVRGLAAAARATRLRRRRQGPGGRRLPQGALRSCYERAVRRIPARRDLHRAHRHRRERDSGHDELAGSTLRWLSMERCLLQLVRTWRFPPPADGKTAAVDYPLAFRREAADRGA